MATSRRWTRTSRRGRRRSSPATAGSSRKLWGIANQHSFGHHGQYTTLREAVLAHAGEASDSSAAFRKLAAEEQNALIEFLKSLQILPPGTRCLIVDENYACGERPG